MKSKQYQKGSFKSLLLAPFSCLKIAPFFFPPLPTAPFPVVVKKPTFTSTVSSKLLDSRTQTQCKAQYIPEQSSVTERSFYLFLVLQHIQV